MGARVINEPQLYCEDSVGNFTGLFKEGDCVKVKRANGELYEGTLDNIFNDCIELDTEEEGFLTIGLDDIEEINEW